MATPQALPGHLWGRPARRPLDGVVGDLRARKCPSHRQCPSEFAHKRLLLARAGRPHGPAAAARELLEQLVHPAARRAVAAGRVGGASASHYGSVLSLR